MENASKQEWQTRHWKIPPRELFSLTGQTAIVTGGASGLGRAIALGLDAFGASVAIADIDIAGARRVAKMLENESLAIEIDVTRAASVSEMVRTTMQKFGRIDIAFNIPGINIRKSVLELKEDEWRRVIEVNLKGLFLSAREIGRVMLGQGKGSMVNMASARGLVGGASQSAYSASKGGVIQLTRCLAIEWAPHVRVNAIAPGYMKTPLVSEAMKDTAWHESMRALHPIGRFGDPEEIVGPAVFLATDASSFVTGAVLSVDGGWTAQ